MPTARSFSPSRNSRNISASTLPAEREEPGAGGGPMKWLTVQEAAAHVGISVSLLNRLRCVGGGPPFVKVGRCVRYSVADLDQWMVSHLRSNTSQEDVLAKGGDA